MAHRTVAPEWLDQLPAQDPRAVQSRRDLRLLNFWMGNVRTMHTVLAGFCKAVSPMRLAELGAGDGTFFLRLARSLGRPPLGAKVFLVDQRPSVSSSTRAACAGMGWTVEIVAANVFEWLPAQERFDVLIANLFLHHFEPSALRVLLGLIGQNSRFMAACEPRRCALALTAGCLLRLLGCNVVTRHDAPISVRAGFRAGELSAAWPAPHWKLREERAGLFSHLFAAQKLS
jgi:2-polyprenyl-3-methyl-5-hydroxy-6-metoxy-1,4-benzoquinol methylase